MLTKSEDFHGEAWSQGCCMILGKSDIADTHILDLEHMQLCDKARLFLNHLLYSSPSADYFNTKHIVWQKNC